MKDILLLEDDLSLITGLSYSFKKQGFSYVIEEENLTDQTLLTAVKEVYSNKDKYIKNMSESGQMDSISTIISLIKEQSK